MFLVENTIKIRMIDGKPISGNLHIPKDHLQWNSLPDTTPRRFTTSEASHMAQEECHEKTNLGAHPSEMNTSVTVTMVTSQQKHKMDILGLGTI